MKNFILISLLVITQSLGDIWLSRGMKQFGEVKIINPLALPGLAIHLFTNLWIWLGIAFLITSMLIYLTAISKLDLSYVLPMSASSYVLNALFAWLILGEHISLLRWSGTLIVSVGVMLVGLSEVILSEKQKAKSKKQKFKGFFLYLLPLSFSISKTWLAIIIIVLADSAGDLLLASGMKQVGEVSIKTFKQLLKLAQKIITNPLIRLGVFCQSLAFFSFISVLSWADISFVRPATALGYVVSLQGARYILKEKVNNQRLIGTIVICIGIALISFSSDKSSI